MFQVPPPTRYDLQFNFFSISVRVHPFFWLIALIFGANGDSEPVDILIWIAVVFFSILIHEVGHIIAMRSFGEDGYVVLHGFGGLAIPTSGYGRRTPQQQIAISLAGPAAGFLLAAIIMLAVWALGGFVAINTNAYIPLPVAYLPQAGAIGNEIIWITLYINTFWGLLNLVPVIPLDGGQTAAGLFAIIDPRGGHTKALQLSVITGIIMATIGITIMGSIYIGFLFGLLAYQSYQRLSSSGRF